MGMTFTKMEKYTLAGRLIKVFTMSVGGALILTEIHPYMSLTVLAIGAAANELVVFLQEKDKKDENEKVV